jgi:hypothetical protein
MQFSCSTQATHWIFSSKELLSKKNAIRERLLTNYPDMVSVAEEETLKRFFAHNVIENAATKLTLAEQTKVCLLV